MPSLVDRSTNNTDTSGYEPVNIQDTPVVSLHGTNTFDPGLNRFLRCPLPPIWTTSSDSLSQYYQGGIVPQVRLFNPPANTAGSNSGSVTNNTTVISSSGSSSSSTTTSLAITQTSVKTPTISPNARFAGSFTLSKSFQLISLGVSAPCRIQLYSTSSAQSSDSYRGLDIAPPAGTVQGIICDVALDTSPLLWNFQDRIGSNGDSPASSTIYITVTNLDTTSDIITVTFGYVPIVS